MIRKERERNVVTTQEIEQGKKQELANRKGQKLLVNFSGFFSAVALIAVQLRGSFLCLIFIHRSNEIYFIENCDMPIRSWKKEERKVWTENEQNLNTNGKRRNIDCQHWSRKQIVNADYRGLTKGKQIFACMTLHQIVGREPSRAWDKGSHAKLNIHNPSIEEIRTKRIPK